MDKPMKTRFFQLRTKAASFKLLLNVYVFFWLLVRKLFVGLFLPFWQTFPLSKVGMSDEEAEKDRRKHMDLNMREILLFLSKCYAIFEVFPNKRKYLHHVCVQFDKKELMGQLVGWMGSICMVVTGEFLSPLLAAQPVKEMAGWKERRVALL